MASISTDKNGNRTVQFVGPDRKRRSVRLGRVPMKNAEEVCRRVEALVASRITGTATDADTARWVAGLTVAMARKLARVGLVGPRSSASTLDTFVRSYIASRTDLKPSTLVAMQQTRDRLMSFFAPTTPLRDVTVGDAKRFLIHLREKYAEATAARTLKRSRQFFAAAKDDLLIPANPFDGIKPGSMKNPERLYFVTAEMAAKLVDAAPDADWRAIIALARYGGLRCPSEVLALNWCDVDWDRGRFLVRASKTEHHEHRGMRWVPIFPELRPHLEALWDLAEPGAVHVVTRYREAKQNLRTTFEKVILRAGLTPWPRLFQNLRASRETELAARFPLHVVTAWMGNTEAVAARHYLSVTDNDFAEALKQGPAGGAVHIPVQQPAAPTCKEAQPTFETPEKTRGMQGRAVPRIPTQVESMAAVGLEPTRPVRGRGFSYHDGFRRPVAGFVVWTIPWP
jgi:integrase